MFPLSSAYAYQSRVQLFGTDREPYRESNLKNWFDCVCLDVLTINLLQTSGSVSLYQAHSLGPNVLITLEQKVLSDLKNVTPKPYIKDDGTQN